MSDKESGKQGGVAGDASRASLLDGFLRRAGKVAGGTFDIAMDVATMSAMFGDSWLRDFLASSASPERLEAMAEAGRFLRDARETAGLSLNELAERLDISDDAVLEGVERGEAILPLELMLRATSLLARHDPVPFLIQFLRSYNPQLEATLEQWGVMALPKNFERERRFLNLYRQHDFLRDLDDDEYQRFVEYMDASTHLVVDVMQREAAAVRGEYRPAKERSGSKAVVAKTKAASATVKKPRSKAPVKAKARKSIPKTTPRSRPVVRKVRPRDSGR